MRDTEDDLLYNHSRRVFFWAALTGERRKLKYDPELLYIGAMFHDMGLTPAHASKDLRFEVDGANAARDFLKSYDVAEARRRGRLDRHRPAHDAGHSRAYAPDHRAGDHRRRDGRARHRLSRLHRRHSATMSARIIRARPNFKENIIDHFANGIIAKPLTTFGNVKADVLALKDPNYSADELLQHHPRLGLVVLITGGEDPSGQA